MSAPQRPLGRYQILVSRMPPIFTPGIPFWAQSTAGSGGTAPQSVTFSNPVVSGDLIVVTASAYNGSGALGSVTSVTDNKGNTYHRAVEKDRINGMIEVEMWYAYNITGGSGFQVTVNAASLSINVVAQEFTGILTGADPLNVVAVNNGNSGSLVSGTTATLLGVNELVVGAFTSDVSLTFTLGSGYSNLSQESSVLTSVMMESLVASVTTGQQATATMSGSSDYAGVVATFRSSSSPITSSRGSFFPLFR